MNASLRMKVTAGVPPHVRTCVISSVSDNRGLTGEGQLRVMGRSKAGTSGRWNFSLRLSQIFVFFSNEVEPNVR